MSFAKRPTPTDFDSAATILAASAAATASPATGPNAELLRHCVEHDFLMVAEITCMKAIRDDSCLSYLQDLEDRMDQIKLEIVQHPPLTEAGHKALARTTLGAHTPFFQNGKFDAQELDQKLVSHLLTSLAA